MTGRLSFVAGIVIFSCLSTVACSAQKMNVKIIQRQNNETGFSVFVPSYSSSTSNTNVNCYAGSTDVNCSGRTTTDGYRTPARTVSYSVTGATLSLLLPDGRVAVVNCVSKYKPGFQLAHERSCRIPYVDDIQTAFKGKNAKLFWSVSVDGKKFDSETYKILAVLDK